MIRRLPRCAPCVTTLCLVLLATACGRGEAGAQERLEEGLQSLAEYVDEWESAPSLEAARAAAEGAANIVVGPDGAGYGDRDGDGNIRGSTDVGLLPGGNAEARGLALDAVEAGARECVRREVLGGSWDDPAARWMDLERATRAWQPGDNMSQLDSSVQRVAGWALVTLEADTVEQAEQYAGSASSSVADAQRALFDCRSAG